jgi:hypothetical protein
VISEAESVACLGAFDKKADSKSNKPTKSEESCKQATRKTSKDECESNKPTGARQVLKGVLKVSENLVKDKPVSRPKNCEKGAALFNECTKEAENLIKTSGDYKVNMEKVFEILSSKIKADEVIVL